MFSNRLGETVSPIPIADLLAICRDAGVFYIDPLAAGVPDGSPARLLAIRDRRFYAYAMEWYQRGEPMKRIGHDQDVRTVDLTDLLTLAITCTTQPDGSPPWTPVIEYGPDGVAIAGRRFQAAAWEIRP